MKELDKLVAELFELTHNFIFIEYYTHTRKNMYKILNEYTKFRADKLVLCEMDDGIELALKLAIEQIRSAKDIHQQ